MAGSEPVNGTERFPIPCVGQQQRADPEAYALEIPALEVRRPFGSFHWHKEFPDQGSVSDPGIVFLHFHRTGVQLGATVSAPAAAGVISGQDA